MSTRDYMRHFSAQMQPVRDAIDDAVRRGGIDPESILEDLQSYLDWWTDELADDGEST